MSDCVFTPDRRSHQMAKAWVIVKGWGEYSDRGTCPAKVYLDAERAQKAMAALEAIYDKYQKVIRPPGRYFDDYDAAQKMGPQIADEYAAIGFDAGWEDDWELVETELEQ